MNFLRCRTVACAEQRIHLRFRPRSLLLLHSRQMLTWWWGKDRRLRGSPAARRPRRCGPTPITPAGHHNRAWAPPRQSRDPGSLNPSPPLRGALGAFGFGWLPQSEFITACFPSSSSFQTLSLLLWDVKSQHNPDFCASFIERRCSGKHRRGPGRSPVAPRPPVSKEQRSNACALRREPGNVE